MCQVAAPEAGQVAVHAHGPAAVAFSQRGGADGLRYAASLIAAGSYLVHAQVAGRALPGWPKPLHVAAGPSDASWCLGPSPAPQRLPCALGHTLAAA